MPDMKDRQSTIVAIATPPGKSGIGIIRVSGERSLAIARTICRTEIIPRHAHLCIFKDSHDRVIDQGILLYFNSPNSFTGEDVVEFQGHGGQVVLNLLLKEILSLGARLARPGEFTERAYLNERIDLVQAEAVADLIDSVSEQAARSAMRSLEGEFSRQINSLLAALISVRVFVESALDFPEEEIDFLKESDTDTQLQNIDVELEKLLKSAKEGRRLREGIRAVIIGRPNVGKSSLLNCIIGVDKAIVTGIAGTTRDIIEDTIFIDGLSIDIVDTAGLREPTDLVEAEGIRRSLGEIDKAGIIILVSDHERLLAEEEEILKDTTAPPEKVIVVHNKIDLNDNQPRQEFIGGVTHIYASMKTGAGLDIINKVLRAIATAGENSEHVVLARERHIQALITAQELIRQGLTGFRKSGQGEILAEELNKAQKALAEITGEFHSEDLLGEIFSRFCIGK